MTKRFSVKFAQAAAAATTVWATAAFCFSFHAHRSTAAMALVLEALASAVPGDWVLAVLTSLTASLALSWYYIEGAGSFRISTLDGWVIFLAMLITALAGSALAVRARRRMEDAERRNADLERLQSLGEALLTRDTLAEAAQCAVHRVVELFGVEGVEIRMKGTEVAARAGCVSSGEHTTVVKLDLPSGNSELALYGAGVCANTLGPLGHLIELSLGRARALEERARTEGEQRGEKLRSIVLNGLAQSFRTPLTSIKAAASTLRVASFIQEGPGKELARIIDEEADKLDRLIGDSLNFARIESHRVNPVKEACSLADITDRVILRLAPYLAGRELAIDVGKDLPCVPGDRFLLEQMLFEVVDNAWKYSRPGTRVAIEASVAGDSVVLTVRTEGDEIADHERDMIFAKFYRGAVHRSPIEGTGIGLAFARAVAEAHKGTIRLDREQGGHVFRFLLPAGR